MFTMSEKPPIGSDGPYYRCLCETHVRTGSNIIAAIVLVFGFFELFQNLLTGGIFIILASLMIFAHIKANPWAYWPFLGVAGCFIAFNLILTIACAFMGPTKMAETFDIYPKSQEGKI
uniref:Uncharacterized protein n=1 Tax=Acrobeloides nanus TaxID=290746 RepID=A0A914EET1_9BILA